MIVSLVMGFYKNHHWLLKKLIEENNFLISNSSAKTVSSEASKCDWKTKMSIVLNSQKK